MILKIKRILKRYYFNYRIFLKKHYILNYPKQARLESRAWQCMAATKGKEMEQ